MRIVTRDFSDSNVLVSPSILSSNWIVTLMKMDKGWIKDHINPSRPDPGQRENN